MIIIHTSMRVDNNLHLHIAAYLIVSFDYYEIDIDKLLAMLNANKAVYAFNVAFHTIDRKSPNIR